MSPCVRLWPDEPSLHQDCAEFDGRLACAVQQSPFAWSQDARLELGGAKRDNFPDTGGGRWRVGLGSRVAMTKEEERELRQQLARLQQEHRDLDAAIAALQDSPGSDVLQVQRFKKRKLYLRDRISFIED